MSSSLAIGIFSGPWIALRRPFKFCHSKLFLGIVSHMSRSVPPAIIVLIPIMVLSMIALLIEFIGVNFIALVFVAGSLALALLSLAVAVVFELPIVNEITAWASSSIPENWEQRRDRWIAIHKVRVYAGFGSLFSLIAALVFRYR